MLEVFVAKDFVYKLFLAVCFCNGLNSFMLQSVIWHTCTCMCLHSCHSILQMAAVSAIPALCTEYYRTSTGMAVPKKQGILC